MLRSSLMRRKVFPGSFRGQALVILALAVLFVSASEARSDPGLRILVWKSQRQIWVTRGNAVIRRYPVSLGKAPKGAKETRGDGRTPVGVYYVYEKRPTSKYHRFLALNYPAIQDAERALRAGLITADTWADIWIANTRRQKPPWNTPLGGFVGIHGTGGQGRQAQLRRLLDWTEGCIALSDQDVEELYEITPVGTPVEIYE